MTVCRRHHHAKGCKLTVTGVVINVFEAVDVITLIKGGVYDDLNLTVGEAIQKRSDVSHCTSGMGDGELTTAFRTSLAYTPVLWMTVWILSLTPSESPVFTGSL